MQTIPFVGPIPVGGYTIGAAINSGKMGPLALPLQPDESNTMWGRDEFFVHGDSTPPGTASEGCIIMPNAIRQMIMTSNCPRLQVVP